MTILQKDFTYQFSDSYTTVTNPGLPATPEYWSSTPPTATSTIATPVDDSVITTAAIQETPGYVRPATWEEVKNIWPWIKADCAISKKILTTVMTTKTLGATIFNTFMYRKEVQIPGGPLQVYFVHIAIQHIVGFGVGFCAVTGDASTTYLTVEPNPIYYPTFKYIEGTLGAC